MLIGNAISLCSFRGREKIFSPSDLDLLWWHDPSDVDTISNYNTNLITGDSSDFEGGTVGSWAMNGGGSNSASAVDPLSGSYSMVVNGAVFARAELTVTTVSSTFYNFSMLAKVTSGKLTLQSWTGVSGFTYNYPGVLPDDGEVLIEGSFTATGTSVLMRLYPNYQQGGSGTFKVDDIEITDPFGNKLVLMEDLSTNGDDAYQNTAANQPVYAAETINGLPAITFAGSTEFLNLTNGISTTGAFSWSGVIESDITGLQAILGHLSDDTIIGEQAIKEVASRLVNGGSFDSNVSVPSSGTAYLLTVMRDASDNVKVSINGAPPTTVFTSTGTSNFNVVGTDVSGNYFNGLLGENIAVDAELSEDEITQFYEYIQEKGWL